MKQKLCVLLILMGIAPLLMAQTGIDFNIRFFDRRVYFVEQNPIFVQVTITNNNPAPFRFKLADERAFSVDFDVRTASNQPVAAANALVRLRSQSQQVFFREISLAAGESFSFVEDLRDYSAFTQNGTHIVQAQLYPELFQSANAAIVPGRTLAASGQALSSNRLSLNLRPDPFPGPDGIPLDLDVETGAVLVRERLPPDEVVSYLLTARQKGQWERFFLYLDLETMLSRDAYRRRQWLAESEEGRRRMVARYRQDLQNAEVDGEISLIPLRFIIERTEYSAGTGTVTTVQYFREGDFLQRKRYEWFLERRDEIWTIAGYSVVHLGAVDRLPE